MGYDNVTDSWRGLCAIELDGGGYALAMATPSNSSERVSDSGETNVKDGSGTLDSIIFNDPVAGLTATIYDSLSSSGTIIAAPAIPALLNAAPFQLFFNRPFSTGLTINLSTAADLTVLYR